MRSAATSPQFQSIRAAINGFHILLQERLTMLSSMWLDFGCPLVVLGINVLGISIFL
jgi:hypothetical protein